MLPFRSDSHKVRCFLCVPHHHDGYAEVEGDVCHGAERRVGVQAIVAIVSGFNQQKRTPCMGLQTPALLQ